MRIIDDKSNNYYNEYYYNKYHENQVTQKVHFYDLKVFFSTKLRFKKGENSVQLTYQYDITKTID